MKKEEENKWQNKLQNNKPKIEDYKHKGKEKKTNQEGHKRQKEKGNRLKD